LTQKRLFLTARLSIVIKHSFAIGPLANQGPNKGSGLEDILMDGKLTTESLSRRRFLLAGGSAALGTVLWGCHGNKSGGNAILRVAATGKGDSDTRAMIKATGIEPVGYEVSYSEFAGGNLVVEAFNGGSLDYGGMSEIPAAFAASSTIHSFRLIAVMHGDVNNQVILVPKGSTIHSLRDLKGKRIGYVRATTAQYFLIRMLESVGLTWADIQPVAIGVADGAAAFAQGSLDAWAIYGYPIQRAIATEGARILKTALGFLSGNYVIAAHVDSLKDEKKVAMIRSYLEITRQGFNWAAQHQDEWAAIAASEIGIPVEYMREEYSRKSDNYSLRPITSAAKTSLQSVADVFTRTQMIPRQVDTSLLWDSRFNDLLERGA
jgi:sulfonate transport system substrate-binding protein